MSSRRRIDTHAGQAWVHNDLSIPVADHEVAATRFGPDGKPEP
jgi:hypothetical protein